MEAKRAASESHTADAKRKAFESNIPPCKLEERLSFRLLCSIFSFLDPFEHILLFRGCKRFRELARLPAAWPTDVSFFGFPAREFSLSVLGDALRDARKVHFPSMHAAGAEVPLRWCRAIGQLKHLEFISFVETEITANVMACFASCSSLRAVSFDLQTKLCKGACEPLSALPLTEVRFYRASVAAGAEESECASLGMLPLRSIDINHAPKCFITVALQASATIEHASFAAFMSDRDVCALVGACKRLRTLSISGGQSLTAVAFRELAKLPLLTALDLRNCVSFGDGAFTALAACTTLTSLNFESAYGARALDLAELASLPRLQSLTLQGLQLSAAHVAQLARFPHLTTLRLRAVGLTAKALAPLKSSIAALTELDLSWNAIGYDALEPLSRLPLKQLRVLSTNVLDADKALRALAEAAAADGELSRATLCSPVVLLE